MIRIVLLLALLPAAVCAETPTKLLIVPPEQRWAYDDWHFSPAVRVGDTIWLSGQAGDLDADFEAGVRRLFEGIRVTLAAAGAELADVVEIVTYHRDMSRLPAFAAVHQEYFPSEYPAWTAVGVTALADPALDLEIKVTAVAGSGGRVSVLPRVSGAAAAPRPDAPQSLQSQ